MKSLPLPFIIAALCSNPIGLRAQDEVRPPRAVPIPEEVEVEPVEAVPPPGTPPKAKPVQEDEPPPDDSPPDEPWEPEDVRKERLKEEAKRKAAGEKAKAEMEQKEREQQEAEKDEVVKGRAVPNTPPAPIPLPPRDPKAEKPKIPIAKDTDPNAKPLSLLVPAPRGLIVDRHGQPLAQEKIAHYIGVQLPMQEGLTDVEILDRARGPLAFCQMQLPEKWDVTDSQIISHYKKRRWVPFYSSTLVPEDRVIKLKESLPPGVILRPIFLRTYPEQSLAGHLIGHMGKNENGFFSASNQDLQADELMWPPTAGRYGLEKRFEKELAGEPGHYSALFDSKGGKLAEESRPPRAGHTVVTTLDIEMQKTVERKLREEDVRGAFVIMDVKTGDVVAMASNPCFNPNDWTYSVSDEFFKKMNEPNQVAKPMFCRAIQGLYPPASTFKVITALAALETDDLSPSSEFDCPPGMYFNRVYIRNHSRNHEGSMDVERAIIRSCNTWFFQAAKACGPGALSDMAMRFGFGSRTGICLDDMKGFMPTPESYAANKGSMTGGILAITSIGQGEVLSTPLQVCQMMAGIARGDAVPRPRLVRLIQDVDGRVVQHFAPSTLAPLGLEKANLDAVRRGMRGVVAGAGGTGSRAENSYVSIAGKTGTGEWKEDRRTGEKQYVAWFAGFIPYKNPEYAYACLYEGDPGDSISGGKKVAPIVGDVFNDIYKAKKNRGELKDLEDDETFVSERVARRPRAETQPAPAPVPAPVVEQPRRGGLSWLFRRRKPQPQAQPVAPVPHGGRPLR